MKEELETLEQKYGKLDSQNVKEVIEPQVEVQEEPQDIQKVQVPEVVEEQKEEPPSESSDEKEEFNASPIVHRSREILVKLINDQRQELQNLNQQIDRAAETEDFDMAEELSAQVEQVNLEIERLEAELAQGEESD